MSTFLTVSKESAKDFDTLLHYLYTYHYALPLLVNDNNSIQYYESDTLQVSLAYGISLIDLKNYNPDHQIPLNYNDCECSIDYWNRYYKKQLPLPKGKKVLYPQLDFLNYVRLLHLLTSYCGDYGHDVLVFHEFPDRWELESQNSDPRKIDYE